MKSAVEKNEVRYRLEFFNVDYDAGIEKSANLRLAQILAYAPQALSRFAPLRRLI